MIDDTRVGWWERLGGPNAISLPAWLLTLPGAILSAPTLAGDQSRNQVLEWCALGAIAHLMTGVILFIAWLTVLPHRRRPARPWTFVLVVIIAGMLRGLLMAYGSVRLGLTEDLNLFARMVAASWALLLWLSLATLIVDGTRRHRATMAHLRLELRREQTLVEASAARLRDYRASIVAELRETVRVPLQGAVALAADPRQAAERLQHVIRDVVRPLSHELESRTIADDELVEEVGESPVAGPLPLREYAEAAVTHRPFAPLLTSGVVLGTSAILVLYSLGPVAGIACLILDVFVVYAATLVARRVWSRRLRSFSTAACAACIVVAFAMIAVASGLTLLAVVFFLEPKDVLAPTAAPAVMAMGVFVAFGAQLAAAAEGAVAGRRRQAEEDLRDATAAAEWARARLRQQAFLEHREMGRILHGEVQARMVSVALQLQLDPPDNPGSAIAELEARIQQALGDRQGKVWREDLSDLEELWSHAIELSVTVDDSASARLDEDAMAAQSVVVVIQEAVTNAVRHGAADRVHATVEGDALDLDDVLVVRVDDDGVGASTDLTGGLGSRTFDGVCLDWSLDVAGGGRLVARIATRSGVPVFEEEYA